MTATIIGILVIIAIAWIWLEAVMASKPPQQWDVCDCAASEPAPLDEQERVIRAARSAWMDQA